MPSATRKTGGSVRNASSLRSRMRPRSVRAPQTTLISPPRWGELIPGSTDRHQLLPDKSPPAIFVAPTVATLPGDEPGPGPLHSFGPYVPGWDVDEAKVMTDPTIHHGEKYPSR